MPWRSINVRFLRSWEIAWPARPPTPPDLVLQVDSVGVLNLQPWIDMNNGSPKELPEAWWRALLDAKVVATDTTKAPLADLLINMVSIAKLKPLFAQLLTQASQYIEVILLTIIKRGFRDEFSVDASFADPFAWGQVPRVLDHELLRRMVALQEHCANKTRFHISTDKANVNTISLMNTLMSVEQVAEVLPPQALPLVSIKRLAG